MSAKPVFEETKALSPTESKRLARQVMGTSLSEHRRETLKGYSIAVRQAFERRK